MVNAAGYQTIGIYTSGHINAGEIVAIFGQGLGPAAGVGATVDAQGYLPTNIAGVSVTFNGTPAPLLYVSAGQVNVTDGATGSGQAAALNQDGSLNSANNPAARGSIVSIWVSGLGPMSPAYPDGLIVQGALSQYVPAQINFVIPPTAPTGPAIPLLFFNVQPSATIAIK